MMQIISPLAPMVVVARIRTQGTGTVATPSSGWCRDDRRNYRHPSAAPLPRGPLAAARRIANRRFWRTGHSL